MRLSRRSIETLAQMICGKHGNPDHPSAFSWPNFPYRTGNKLTEFFSEYCGLLYEHEGTRITWTTEVLKELNVDNPNLPSDNIVRVIKELLESVQPENHLDAIQDVNTVLIKDGLQIRFVNGEYIFAKLNRSNSLNGFVEFIDLEKCLDDFVHYIKADKRMSFWRFDRNEGQHKWKSKPEQHAKDLLHTYLDSRFRNSIQKFEEIESGAGRIDLFVVLTNGEQVVIELKMCGTGYSAPYAQSGIRQLVHYMENKDSELGYLIVFDSRIRDISKGFKEKQTINNMAIITKIVDVRPHI